MCNDHGLNIKECVDTEMEYQESYDNGMEYQESYDIGIDNLEFRYTNNGVDIQESYDDCVDNKENEDKRLVITGRYEKVQDNCGNDYNEEEYET